MGLYLRTCFRSRNKENFMIKFSEFARFHLKSHRKREIKEKHQKLGPKYHFFNTKSQIISTFLYKIMHKYINFLIINLFYLYQDLIQIKLDQIRISHFDPLTACNIQSLILRSDIIIG